MSTKPRPGATKPKGSKPSKIQHPDSRVAAQQVRKAVRKDRLADLRSKAKSKTSTRLEFYAFIHARLGPESATLTLPEMHTILHAWVSRHDAEISAEHAARRKGRPKSAKEVRLEEVRLREQENYKSGIEIPDLTDTETVAKFRQWDLKSLGYAHLLRFVRISTSNRDVAVLSRPPTATGHEEMENMAEEDDDEAPQLLEVEMDES
ncbi:hypothetical protein HMN09_00710300 [Mycena chlorophos]|uniref:Translation machinery-associated protein 16 n=1 Tax=Mycena chlorophos TaxID=658473 RepID=A0A8H6T0K1_MYCCL|nr:hypothetical protein HMN09_00710300 [Mycena chlorophos]